MVECSAHKHIQTNNKKWNKMYLGRVLVIFLFALHPPKCFVDLPIIALTQEEDMELDNVLHKYIESNF